MKSCPLVFTRQLLFRFCLNVITIKIIQLGAFLPVAFFSGVPGFYVFVHGERRCTEFTNTDGALV